MSANDIFSHLQAHPIYWNLLQGVIYQDFYASSLTPMWKQGLITEENNGYITGSQWKLIKPYQEIFQAARLTGLSIEQLAREKDWITLDKIKFL